jgi:hypothetical protein
MPKKATAADAELILKLYELRRELEMRKARNWWMTEFWPESADDFIKIAMKFPSQENNWMRQAATYWETAATLVLSGALNEELFLHPSCSGEMFFCFAKMQPYLKEFREKLNAPEAFENTEKLVMKTKWGRDRIKMLQQRQADFRKRRAESAKAS